ncbi:MAG: galactokinase [Gemmatimonadales bacterium]|nr:galactokinase [Gemmatimonadales bacterium]NIN11127.1 galactokinase [Gemmatimonadales bacterium]NIN49726.1 galactokinase [Gemmatimonadales bacterium]NIP07190.1 galactokinase [Gemmatimonadales bacterium]NIR00403.1 galactokinase [Gemmatimonadales bacterium]
MRPLEPAIQGPRLEQLQSAFARLYGSPGGSHVVRAPGRVNLIGEHVDYNGLAVLPMAIQRCVAILYRRRDDRTVRIANLDPRFTPRTFTLDTSIEPFPAGDWGNYVKAAAQGLARRFGSICGFDAVVSSDIPIASGLSSSSALVVASALPLVQANDLAIQRIELAELLARAERYVGLQGGGMDQAICLEAKPHSAARIEFDPLRVSDRPIPGEWQFVVAYSLVRAEKSGAARDIYNARTRECGEALAIVTQGLGLGSETQSYTTLIANVGVEVLLERAAGLLDEKLGRRFRHVVTEATRVDEAEAAMADGDLGTFGRLMSESHLSLRGDYEVSCRELDELTDIALLGGAVGARLTGAGLGGCVVALCAGEGVETVLRELSDRFYQTREYDGSLADHLFVAEPSEGASVTAL